MNTVPTYLQAHADTWRRSPHQANLDWFATAGYGMFIHYGLYSQLGKPEWTQYQERIPVAEYAKLVERFDPRHFDVERITDLALNAGMRYINLTACHHEGFCLWNSSSETFNAYQACGRDLVRELGEACARKGLGFFVYFTYMLNWRHPYAMSTDLSPFGQPHYQPADPTYRFEKPEDFRHFMDWSHACLSELAQSPFPIAGIWLDLISVAYRQPELVPVAETYALIRKLRPEALISFKQGFTGDEDFAAPEFHFASLAERCRKQGDERAAHIAETAWEQNRHKHNEICMSLQSRGWGYVADATHKSADELWGNLAYARANNCNLLVNTGPLPDGSLHPEDVATFTEVGRRIAAQGMPGTDTEIVVPQWGRTTQLVAQ